jgi:hypothetical protein
VRLRPPVVLRRIPLGKHRIEDVGKHALAVHLDADSDDVERLHLSERRGIGVALDDDGLAGFAKGEDAFGPRIGVAA